MIDKQYETHNVPLRKGRVCQVLNPDVPVVTTTRERWDFSTRDPLLCIRIFTHKQTDTSELDNRTN